MCIRKEKPSKGSKISIYLMWSGFLALSLINCAVVGVNHYQNAEPLGKNRFKVGFNVEEGREMEAGINIYRGDIDISSNDLDWDSYTCETIGISAQYGVTATTDITLRTTTAIIPTSGSTILSIKQNLLHTPNNFAIAIMPSVGVFGTESSSSGTPLFYPNRRYDRKYDYKGYLAEADLIVSQRWNYFSIFVSPKYIYSSLNIKTDYDEFWESDGSIAYQMNDEETFYCNTYGASTGITLTLWRRLQIIPEISFLRVKNWPKDKYDWTYFPGLDISLKF